MNSGTEPAGPGAPDDRPLPAAPAARSPQRWEDWAEHPLREAHRSRAPLFVERDIYRRRRIMDAARLLPALGAALLLMPMLWARGQGTAAGVIYLFLVWIGLIVAAVVLERRLSEPLREVERGERGPSDGDGSDRPAT